MVYELFISQYNIVLLIKNIFKTKMQNKHIKFRKIKVNMIKLVIHYQQGIYLNKSISSNLRGIKEKNGFFTIDFLLFSLDLAHCFNQLFF